MGHEDRGVAGLVVDFAEPLAELLANLRVESTEGLVEEEDARLDREGAGEGDALALAAGELLGVALVEAGKLDEVEELHRAPADLLARRPGLSRTNLEPERDVLEHRHVAKERIGLEDEADVAILHGLGRCVLVAKEDAAGGRRLEAGDETQERRLPRARGAEEGDQLAGLDAHRNVVERRVAAEFLADVLDANIQARLPLSIRDATSAGGCLRVHRRSGTRGWF